jgi:hypothetical protein
VKGHVDVIEILWVVFLLLAIVVMLRVLGVQI